MDLYVSWNIPKEDLTLDAIWNKFEEFSKPQMKEVRACLDLLTSFCQGTRNVDEWYNTVQAQVNLAKYPPETAKILHHDIFWFFMQDEDFVTKTINEGNVDIQKFPASKVCQLAKRWKAQKPWLNISDKLQGHTSSPGTINVPPMYPTSHWELSQKEIKLDIWPETTKLQDTGSSHNAESTRHAETGCSLR